MPVNSANFSQVILHAESMGFITHSELRSLCQCRGKDKNEELHWMVAEMRQRGIRVISDRAAHAQSLRRELEWQPNRWRGVRALFSRDSDCY